MTHRTTGGDAWTFPVSIILAAVTTWCWVMLFGISRFAIPACELLDRTAWTFACGFGTAGLLLPLTYVERVWMRLVTAGCIGAAATAAGWWMGTAAFPGFC
jgi:hypothetical protein